MNEIQIFNNPDFGEIRTAIINGKDYFCGNDIANALNYLKPKDAISRHCKGAMFWRPLGETQEMKYITEGDMYRLIVKASTQGHSKEVKEKAEQFESWIFDEVLPALRSKGSYSIQTDYDGRITDPSKLLELHYLAIRQIDEKTDRNKQEIDSVRNDFESFKMELPILGIEKENIKRAMQKCVIKVSGGRKSNAYRDKSTRGRIYGEIQRSIREQLGIKRYDEIRATDCRVVMDIIKSYVPSDEMEDTIYMCNSQIGIFGK